MAATNKTPILLYGSTTATNQPSAGNLTNSSDGCEIAINVADKNLFFKDSSNAVNTVPLQQSSASSNGWLSSTDWNTFNGKQAALVSGTNIKTVGGVSLLGSGDVGTIGTGYGGTGKTSYTASQILYASSTSALAQSSNLQFNGTGLAVNSPYGILTNFNYGYGAASGSANWMWITANVGASNPSASITGGLLFGSNYSNANSEGNIAYGTYLTFAKWNGTTYTETARITTANDLSIANGNLVIGTSGKGIDFSATADATATSELLADYEEGTWTPTVTPSSGSFTTVTISSATYTKVGRCVNIQSKFILTNSGTGSGTMNISGLPYTANSASNQCGFVARRINDGILLTGQISGGAAAVDGIAKYDFTSAIVNGNSYSISAYYIV